MQQRIEQKAIELLEEKDEGAGRRSYHPQFEKLLGGFLVFWAVFQIYFNIRGSLDAITFRAYHTLFLVVFTFLIYPSKFGEKKVMLSSPKRWDILWILLGVGSLLYLIFNYNRVAMSGGFLSPLDIAVGGVGIVAAIYAGHRTSGNLAWLAVFFLAYNFFGKYIPGALGHTGFSLKRIISHMFWGSQGIFGVGIGVSSTYIFLFVLFGAFLKKSGFSNFLNDLALTMVGHSAGGPAKVAVIASALLGMINGSAVANVATTGTITIPMMKKTGYSKEFAAAVEAVASTGGQFAPPIMGAVGFVMAEYLGVSYTIVMLSAIIPAVLYYLGVIISVHLEAKRLGLKGLSKDQLPNIKELILQKGHLSLPLFVLIGLMILGFSPLYCGVVAIFATIFASALKKETRMSLKDIWDAAAEGSANAISVGMSCVMIGFVIGTVSLTGLGLSFGQLVLQVVGEGQLLLGGVMVMVMSTILGMGVPGVAAYVIVAAVSVPVLIQAGAEPIAAHLFCLIYACLSNITPPVAISSYVASGIAGSDQTKTSLIAVKLGVSGFIIPFFFLIDPVLLLTAVPTEPWMLLQVFLTSVLGVACLSFALEGIMLKKLSAVERVILLFVGLLTIHSGWITDIAGLVLFVAVTLFQLRRAKGEIC
ncbi:MAG: TRAP transporter fused permease subunit [Peptostreptococcaceae bacterium]|nr:TRAP transporter fused permease subunit [Peptostreptococcaceae bacterium]